MLQRFLWLSDTFQNVLKTSGALPDDSQNVLDRLDYRRSRRTNENNVLQGPRGHWINKNIVMEIRRSRWIDENSVLERPRSRWIDKNSVLEVRRSSRIDENSVLEGPRGRWIDKNSILEVLI